MARAKEARYRSTAGMSLILPLDDVPAPSAIGRPEGSAPMSQPTSAGEPLVKSWAGLRIVATIGDTLNGLSSWA